jgi:small subunit ribosomal protein S1
LFSTEQIKQLNEPIEVKITEWNTGGLLSRIVVVFFFFFFFFVCLICESVLMHFVNGNDLLMFTLQGLRAFLPKAELLNRVHNFTELKENVSCLLKIYFLSFGNFLGNGLCFLCA